MFLQPRMVTANAACYKQHATIWQCGLVSQVEQVWVSLCTRDSAELYCKSTAHR